MNGRRFTQINNRSLEALIALARWGGLLLVVLAALAFMGGLWTADWRFPVTGLFLGLWGAGCVYFGWWEYGNTEWRKPLYDGARWGELHCNVPIDPATRRHTGPHQDGLRDGEGLRTWS